MDTQKKILTSRLTEDDYANLTLLIGFLTEQMEKGNIAKGEVDSLCKALETLSEN